MPDIIVSFPLNFSINYIDINSYTLLLIKPKTLTMNIFLINCQAAETIIHYYVLFVTNVILISQ